MKQHLSKHTSWAWSTYTEVFRWVYTVAKTLIFSEAPNGGDFGIKQIDPQMLFTMTVMLENMKKTPGLNSF